MTDETVDCFNCGRPNPEWAQVCRSCGVALRHGESRITPAGLFPTDRDSLLSMGAVIGTILLAVIVGLFVSSLNPTDETVAQVTPTPTPAVEATPSPTVAPTATPEPEATPTPEPELRGTLSFGTGIDDNRQVTGEAETFTPSDNFAYSLSVPGGLGGDAIRNEVARTSDPPATVSDEEIPADSGAEIVAYNLGSASTFVAAWGPGEYVWRIYVGDELVAEQQFRLSEG